LPSLLARVRAFLHPDAHLPRALKAEEQVVRLRTKQRPSGVLVHTETEIHEYPQATGWHIAHQTDGAWLHVTKLSGRTPQTLFQTLDPTDDIAVYKPSTWERVQAGVDLTPAQQPTA
jgi:hypothetical protein